MAPKSKLDQIEVPAGMTLAEHLSARLNELGSMEKLAHELGFSYTTVQGWCAELVEKDYIYRPRRRVEVRRQSA